jgi:hypothetical protein
MKEDEPLDPSHPGMSDADPLMKRPNDGTDPIAPPWRLLGL